MSNGQKKPSSIKEYDAIEAGISKLKETYPTVPDCQSTSGLELCKASYRNIRKIETTIEKKRKDINEESQAKIKLVNSEAKRVTALVQGVSGPFKIARDERLEEIELEEEKRVAGIREEIDGLKVFVSDGHQADSEGVSGLIEAVKLIDCSESFAEFTQEAVRTQKEVLEQLGNILQSKLTAEAAERDRVAAEERQRDIDIQEKINNIRMISADCFDMSSAEIKEKHDELTTKVVGTTEFGNRGNEAEAAIVVELERLNTMIGRAKQIEEVEAEKLRKEEEAEKTTQEEATLTAAEVIETPAPVYVAKSAPVSSVSIASQEKPSDDLYDQVATWANKHGVSLKATNELNAIFDRYIFTLKE